MKTSRRTFIGTSAAALLLPTWVFREWKKVRDLDLSLFCDPHHWHGQRYDLTKPFWQEGMTYATDARICIRTNLLPEPPAESDQRRLPKACSKELGWRHDEATGWRSLASANRRSLNDKEHSHECPACYGVGYEPPYEKCLKCHGDGYLLMDFGEFDDKCYEYEKQCECKTGYVGLKKCGECCGCGEVRYCMQLAAGWEVSPAYYSKAMTLGDVVEFAVIGDAVGEHPKPVQLRFDGGEGLLMPLSVKR